jgi:antitoxin component YwqK of YwqJK toxin-antitoxin module
MANSIIGGKGILYYNNGNVLYEGEYENGNRHGNGKDYSINMYLVYQND